MMAKRKSGGEGASIPRKSSRASRPRSSRPDITRDLRDFASGRPQGWNHEDWEAFLEYLTDRGHDTSNADAIGLALERERLAMALEKVQGVGPRRMQALVDRFVTIWSLRNADVEEIASVANVRRDLAERIKTAVST